MTPKIECDWTTKGNVLAENKIHLEELQENIKSAICPENGHIKYINKLKVKDSFSGEFTVIDYDFCCDKYKEQIIKYGKGLIFPALS